MTPSLELGLVLLAMPFFIVSGMSTRPALAGFAVAVAWSLIVAAGWLLLVR